MPIQCIHVYILYMVSKYPARHDLPGDRQQEKYLVISQTSPLRTNFESCDYHLGGIEIDLLVVFNAIEHHLIYCKKLTSIMTKLKNTHQSRDAYYLKYNKYKEIMYEHIAQIQLEAAEMDTHDLEYLCIIQP